MLMFLGYWLPMILLIGGLIIFKKLFVKCIKPYNYYGRYGYDSGNVIQKPITFPIWEYIVYIGSAFVPVLNLIILVSLLILLTTGDYFLPYSWTGRDYWYEIPESKIDAFFKQLAKLVKKINILLNNKWFTMVCIPFVYLYKIMTKKV